MDAIGQTLKFTKKRYPTALVCPCNEGKSNRDGKFAPYDGYSDKGYCHSCGKTFLPEIPRPERQAATKHTQPIQYISPDVVKSTLRCYEKNTFVKYLLTLYDSETVQSLIDKYGLGTTKNGSCIFWQVDNTGLVRTGKAIKYNSDGHRDKSIPPYFIHSKLKIENIKQCLFGFHLLSVSTSPIGLVESEKTACILAGKFPDYTWMATGGKMNLSIVDVLKGKRVVVFPDTDGFEEWTKRLSPYGFKISRALQNVTTDPGLDLADFITGAKNYFETLKDGRVIEMHPAGYPTSWN